MGGKIAKKDFEKYNLASKLYNLITNCIRLNMSKMQWTRSLQQYFTRRNTLKLFDGSSVMGEYADLTTLTSHLYTQLPKNCSLLLILLFQVCFPWAHIQQM